jgi:hypothetical protein
MQTVLPRHVVCVKQGMIDHQASLIQQKYIKNNHHQQQKKKRRRRRRREKQQKKNTPSRAA